LCSRATVQRWEPDAEAVLASREQEEFVFPSWYTAGAKPREPK
jgi:hypothetical protein